MTQNCLNDTRNSKIDKTSLFWEKKYWKKSTHQIKICNVPLRLNKEASYSFLIVVLYTKRNFQAKEILERNQYPPVITTKLTKIVKNNSTGKQAETAAAAPKLI